MPKSGQWQTLDKSKSWTGQNIEDIRPDDPTPGRVVILSNCSNDLWFMRIVIVEDNGAAQRVLGSLHMA